MLGTRRWTQAGIEPSLADLLSDVIVQALMRADGVRVSELRAIVTKLQHSRDPVPAFHYPDD